MTLVLAAVSVVGAPAAGADSVRDGQWYLSTFAITRAQTITAGAGVTVAMVDTGVDGSIPDLRGAVVAGDDFAGGKSPGGLQPVDGDGHGTNVASLFVGRGTGGSSGVLGAAPAASLLTAAVDVRARRDGKQIGAAIRWATDRGARVISLSIGGTAFGPWIDGYRYAQEHDVVVVSASGNDGQKSTTATCNAPGVVCVGGVDKSLQRDRLSNADPRLAIVGPYATTAVGGPHSGVPVAQPASAPTRYKGSQGTSFAAPVVAGIITLIRAKYPSMNAANVVNRLLRTARPIGASPNPTYGYGIPDAYRALTADVPEVRANPLGSLVTAAKSPASSNPSTSSPRVARARDGSSNTGLIAGVAAGAVVVLGAAVALVTRRRHTAH